MITYRLFHYFEGWQISGDYGTEEELIASAEEMRKLKYPVLKAAKIEKTFVEHELFNVPEPEVYVLPLDKEVKVKWR